MKRNFKFYIAAISVFSFFGAPAFGAEPVKPETRPEPKVEAKTEAKQIKESEAHDVTVEELKKMGITAKTSGPTLESNETANWSIKLIGSISSTCLSKFEILNSQADPEKLAGKPMMFRVRDLGGGVSCKQAEGKGCRGSECIHLSNDPRAVMDLSTEGDGEVALLQIDDRLDPEQAGYFNPEPLSKLSGDIPQHWSAQTLERRAKEKAEKERQDRIDLLTSTISACRKTPQELPVARRAAKALFELEGDRSSFNRVLHELDDVEIKLMVARASTIPLKDLDSLRQDLLEQRTADNAEQIAGALRMLALRLVNQKDKTGKKTVSLEDYRTARDILLDAQDHPALSAKTAASLQKDIDANDTGYLAAFGTAVASSNDPFSIDAFNTEYRGAVERLTSRLRDDCYGENRSMEACSSASTAYRNVAAIPSTVQRLQQERFQQEQKINQQIAQMTGAAGQNGQQGPVTNPMPMTGGAQQNSWVPYQQTSTAAAPMMGNAGFNMGGMNSSPMGSMNTGMNSGAGFWSGGAYGKPSTF